MYVLNVALFACTLCFCGASFVDTLPKCSYKDDECIKTVYKNALHDVANTGVPELNIPPLDPLHLTNITIRVLDALDMTIIDATVKGLKDCVFETFHLDFEKENVAQKIICDLTIKGQFKLSGSSPTLQALIGSSSVSGAGKAKIKLEKVSVSLDFPLRVVKKEDGETYIKVDFKTVKYTYDVGNASFAVENILIGKEDISALVGAYLNENWRMMLKTFGKVFVDKAIEYCFNFSERIFDGIPTKKYFIEDVTAFIKN